jgi:hypothetical protein
VLVSDLQQGGKLDALLAYEWPQRTEVVVKAIPCQGTTNASLQLVTNRDSLAPSRDDDLPDVRITNSPDATNDHFQLRWANDVAQPPAAGPSPSPILDVYVAAGHSTVVRAPARPNQQTAAKLVLTGDDQDFDNALYVMPELRRQVNIVYLGNDDPNDTAGMLYYLRQAFGAGKALTSRIFSRSGGKALSTTDLDAVHLVVVTDALNPENVAPLRRYLESGKPVLLALRSAEMAASLSGLAGVPQADSREAETSRYTMLGRLEFNHPLLKPFADPRFGDFTRIHFWKYRRINLADCPGARVLAYFDNNDPAWFEVPVGRGTLLVWTSGWQPSDSDLALSSKFVPLLYSTLEYGGTLTEHAAQYFIGDAVPIANQMPSGAAEVQIRKPDGSTVPLAKGQQTFTQTDVPGIYTIAPSTPGGSAKAAGLDNGHVEGVPPSNRGQDARDTGSDAATRLSFAINLPAAESRTDPMPIEELEKLGVSLKPPVVVASEVAQRAARHHSFSEMESRQKLWRWVLGATLIVLLIETWLGGWLVSQTRNEAFGDPVARPSAPAHGRDGHATEEPI